MMNWTEIAAPGVQALRPYLPGKPIEELEREYGVSDIIKLASNENPLGPSPKALVALQTELATLALYPDANGFYLKQELSSLHGIDAASITLGNGSNDVLVLLAEAFLTPERNAVFSEYCFAVYPIATQATGATAKIVPALPRDHRSMPLGHDLDAMLAAIDEQTRVVFVANPNNPTGTWVADDALKRFVKAVPEQVIVVIDEAYFEYAQVGGTDAASWTASFDNLVVTRTFSKAYGLAGLRIGYSLSNPIIADLLNRVRQPFNANSLALSAATAALGDQSFLAQSRELNDQGKTQLSEGFKALGISHLPSAANFLLVDFERDALPVYEQLLGHGVIVRPVGNYGLDQFLRVSIGTQAQNEQLLGALKEILS